MMTMNNFQTELLKLQSNMYNFAYMLTANRDAAADLLQETSLKVLDNEHSYSQNTNFKGWVLTIMRNIFINNYRRCRRADTVIDKTDNLYLLSLPQDAASETPEDSYRASEIVKAIHELPDEIGKPFSLMVAGYKYEEIAQQLNIPMGTVKNRIYQARKRLQSRFK